MNERRERLGVGNEKKKNGGQWILQPRSNEIEEEEEEGEARRAEWGRRERRKKVKKTSMKYSEGKGREEEG